MKIYLVGGAVRDKILGINSHDKDWVVVGGSPEHFLAQGYQQVGKDFPVFLHPKTNEEYALARIERKTGQGHQDFQCLYDPSVTLEEDLSRRDLTINAMAMAGEEIIDPFSGLADCKNRLLRHVSPAFVEDPLRCLRVARFAAQLPGFSVARETMELCQQMVAANALDHLSKERIWLEWQKALLCQNPNEFFKVLAAMGAINKATELEFRGLPNDSEVRFALFASNYKDYQLINLKPPVNHSRLADITIKIHAMGPPKTAENILEILSLTDAFRRPEFFRKFLLLAKVSPKFHAWKNIIDTLEHALEVSVAIKPEKIIAQGFQGKAIGEQISKARVEAIGKLL